MLLVDDGGFFPEDDVHKDFSWFLMDAMKLLGTDAVGVSERELRFGLAYLKAQIRRTQLPLLSANLQEAKTRRPALQPYVIKKVGRARVGIFGLMSDKVDLGIARDSLKVIEPSAAAKQTIAELRKKGATVIVLLSQLGKVESEDLAAAVPGIDAVVCGHNVPLIQKGRMIKNTVASYGGEQGQYLSQTILTLDKAGRVTTGDNESMILGPEVGEKPEIAKVVKSFEDAFNTKLQKAEKERIAQQQTTATANADKFLGAELCIRCHKDEGAQWKTTSHSLAWQTLVDQKKEATPDCIPCHVVGYKQPGGFQTSADAPRLANVQCENCHGMGTQHDAFAAQHQVTQAVCITCHKGENDPTFDFAKQFPLIAHGNSSGETIKNMKNKPSTMMKSSGTH